MDKLEHSEEALMKAKSDALRLLSFRPRSEKEMRDNLKKKGYAAETVESAMETLKRQGFVDDEKFAKLYSTSAVLTRPMGKRRIAMEMKKKGLPENVIQGALDNLEGHDEKEAAKKLVYSRFQKMKGLSKEKKKARLFGFLSRRGFSTKVIFDTLTELFKEEAAEMPQEEEGQDS